MSISVKLRSFVRDLDPQTLEDLRQSVAAEIEGRQEKTGFQVEDIHARMSPADKALAADEIARVLRERN
jgi:signal transduction histidine kinase